MKPLPDELTILKNSLNQESPWLILLDITLDTETIRLVRNTKNIEYSGNTYRAFNFKMDVNKLTNAGEIPSLKIRIANQERFLQTYLGDLDGLVGKTCKITIVNEDNLTSDYTELEQIWDITQTFVTEDFVDFQLSLPNLLRIRYPLNIFIANHCSHTYKFRECNYTGALPTCKRTLDDCRAHDNTPRYGGFPGLSDDTVRVV